MANETFRVAERVEWEGGNDVRLGVESLMAAEQLILVDAEDRELGVGEKMEVHLAGALHRAFSVFVFDGRGRLLLQKRAADKYHSAGLWSNTACGHPRPGEATREAARRRLREEMGFDCELREAFEFLYRAELDGALVEHEYDHVFVGTHEGDPAPDPSEVEEWRWVSMSELRRALSEQPHLYSRWLKLAVEGDQWRGLAAHFSNSRGGFEDEQGSNAG
jgi:isopentenyl-diphosphate delta-isomerase